MKNKHLRNKIIQQSNNNQNKNKYPKHRNQYKQEQKLWVSLLNRISITYLYFIN